MGKLLRNRIRERVNMKVKSVILQGIITGILVMLYTIKVKFSAFVNRKQLSQLTEQAATDYLAAHYPDKSQATEYTGYQQRNRSLDLSIIIPVYNGEAYLEECLDSVLGPEFTGQYEVIAINDGSTDQSLAILNRYQHVNKQLKVIDQTNRGLSATRNRGFQISKGQYITFLDADDQLNLAILPDLIAKMKAQQIQMLQASYNTTYQGRVVQATAFKAGQSLAEATDGYPWAKIYDYRLWKQVRFPEKIYFEDTVLLFLIEPQVKRFLASELSLIDYRINETGFIQSNKNKPVNIDSLYVTNWLMQQQQQLAIPMTDQLLHLYLFQLSNMLVRRINGLDEALQEAVFIQARTLILQLPIDELEHTSTLERQIMIAIHNRQFKVWLQLSQLY